MKLTPGKGISEIKAKDGIYALIVSPENYDAFCTSAIRRILTAFRLAGVYVSLNKPSKAVISRLKREVTDTDRLLFLDGSGQPESCAGKSCVLLEGNSLTQLSLAVSEAFKSKQAGFVYIDSVNTLLLNHSSDDVGMFLHFLITKMRNLGLLLALIIVDDEKSKKILPLLFQLCDSLIKT